jgi:N-acetylglucosaminyldiphosphoundecaprenol N-acetyl-beta-D-mannosaminyltransferase
MIDQVCAIRPPLVKARETTAPPARRPSGPFPGNRPPVALLGVALHSVTTEETLRQIEAMIVSRQPRYVVTANVDFLIQARKDVELHRLLLEADLAVCDGMPLVWASGWLGNPLSERVAGSDLVPQLIELAARKKYRIFFLGGAPDVTVEAVNVLSRQFPELVIAGHYSPPFRPLLDMDHDTIVQRIQAAKPDLLFLSFGCPKAEKWMGMNFHKVGVPVTISVGATIDFLAGRMKRAPLWMRRYGLEWCFRLWQEPRRLWRRYVTDLWGFSWAIAWQWRLLRPRPAGFPGQPPVLTTGTSHAMHLAIPDRLDLPAIRAHWPIWEQVVQGFQPCVLALENIRHIDSTGVGLLVHLRKQLCGSGRGLVLLAPSAAVRTALKFMRLDSFFQVAPNEAVANALIRSWKTQPAAVTRLAPYQLRWQGEVLAINVEQMGRQTEEQIDAANCSRAHWVIDLSGVSFMDSSGVGLMIRLKKRLQSQGVHLSFSQVQPAVRNVLRLTRLESYLLGEAA